MYRYGCEMWPNAQLKNQVKQEYRLNCIPLGRLWKHTLAWRKKSTKERPRDKNDKNQWQCNLKSVCQCIFLNGNWLFMLEPANFSFFSILSMCVCAVAAHINLCRSHILFYWNKHQCTYAFVILTLFKSHLYRLKKPLNEKSNKNQVNRHMKNIGNEKEKQIKHISVRPVPKTKNLVGFYIFDFSMRTRNFLHT